MTIAILLLMTAYGGAQFVAEYPSMDLCVDAAREHRVIITNLQYAEIVHQFICVDGPDWGEGYE